MKICYENPLKEIKNTVEKKAKFQKVMLLYDDYVSNVQITEIYDSIRGFCVYNCCNIKNIDENEIYNGYKLVIFVCGVDSFLKCNLKKDEFINIFFPQDSAVLPYLLNDSNMIEKSENYLIIQNSNIDFVAMASLSFNLFYNYFANLMKGNR